MTSRNFTRKLLSYRSKVQPIIDINERKKKIDTMMSKIAARNIAIQELEKLKQDSNKEFRDYHRRTLTNKYIVSEEDKEDYLLDEDFIGLDDEDIQQLQSDIATEFRQFTKNHRQLINNLKREREELRNQIAELRKNMGGTKKRHKYKIHKKYKQH